MSRDDFDDRVEDDRDDLDREAIPEADDAPSPSERVRARSFGDLIDKAIAGRPPAAMSADDRALLEVATAIRAAAGPIELEPARRTILVEEALRQAVDRRRGEAPAAPGTHDRIVRRPDTARVEAPTPARWRRAAPWMIAAASTGAAAAAALALWLGRPVSTPEAAAPVAVQALPSSQRSRPADALVGRIPRERAGEAASRIDAIYADRLAGYRERAFAGASARARGQRGEP